jgi:hypothetical protein
MPDLDQQLYSSFENIRSKKVEMSGNDFTAKAEEIRDNLLLKSYLSAEQKGILISFKASHGFISSIKMDWRRIKEKSRLKKLIIIFIKIDIFE